MLGLQPWRPGCRSARARSAPCRPRAGSLIACRRRPTPARCGSTEAWRWR